MPKNVTLPNPTKAIVAQGAAFLKLEFWIRKTSHYTFCDHLFCDCHPVDARKIPEAGIAEYMGDIGITVCGGHSECLTRIQVSRHSLLLHLAAKFEDTVHTRQIEPDKLDEKSFSPSQAVVVRLLINVLSSLQFSIQQGKHLRPCSESTVAIPACENERQRIPFSIVTTVRLAFREQWGRIFHWLAG